MENLVYFESKRKEYAAYIGKNKTKKIDFVAIRQYEQMIGDILIEIAGNMPYDNYVFKYLA